LVVNSEEHCERVLRAIEATLSGDTSAMTELFTDDVVMRSPMVSASSRVELAVELEDRDDMFLELEVRAGPLAVGADWVCAEWVASAVRSGRFMLEDGSLLAPTEAHVTLHGATVAEFASDQICALRHYWDQMGLLAEVRLFPEN
jgi:hypothetical protein